MKTHLTRLVSRFPLSAAALTAAAALALAGCTTPDPTTLDISKKPEPTREVRAADSLFQSGRYQEAIVACIDITRKDPMTSGLADLQSRILTELAQLRRKAIQDQQAAMADTIAVDALRLGMLPDTYQTTRHVIGETHSLKTPLNDMQRLLREPVTLVVTDGNLDTILGEVKKTRNINFIADSDVGEGKSLSIQIENLPLLDILEYVGRNMDITFTVGQNVIWITSGNDNKQGTVPMPTRIYPLRKGLPGDEVPGGSDLNAAAQDGDASTASGTFRKKQRNRGKQSSGPDGAATPPSDDDSYEISIVVAIRRFVPQPPGADITFDTRSHVLLVKNTHENLILTEDIIHALDVRPLQVLIEARFIGAIARDTRSLGIDWLLGGPVAEPSAPGVTPEVNTTLNTLTIPDGGLAFPNKDVTLSGNPLAVAKLQGGAGTFLYQGVLDNMRLKAVLAALETSKQTKTLTAPRVTTVNNKTANIHIGEDFQYYDNLSINTNNPVSQLSGSPTKIKLGYKLAVTPSVGADLATINLALVPSITDLLDKEAWRRAQNPDYLYVQQAGKLPIVLKKMLETEVIVRSGETVVLGGLAQAAGDKDISGLPWLASIPWLGQLFRKDTTIEGTDNLLIFVTATILSDVGEEMIPLTPRVAPGTEVTPAALREEIGIEDRPPE